MGKFDALFEDEDDIFAGTPQSKFWDIRKQLSDDLFEDEFDNLVERLAIMEMMLSETHNYEDLDKIIAGYRYTDLGKVEELKKSTYMELAGQLIYRVSE